MPRAMSRQLHKLLQTWLDWLGVGVVLSTAFCVGLLQHDVQQISTITQTMEGGALIRATLWGIMCLLFAPAAAATDVLFRDPNDDTR